MATTRKLTPNAIDNLTSGKLKDPERPGLTVEATRRAKVWVYNRRISGTGVPIRLRLGSYPAFTIADARKWADDLNAKVERGEDPRVAKKAALAVEAMTVAVAHGLYIADISKGDRKPLKPRTIEDKQTIYRCDIQPKLGSKALASVTADDLWEVVEAKGEASPVLVRASRAIRHSPLQAGGRRGSECPGSAGGSRRATDPGWLGMTRRKGERPVPRRLDTWSPTHPVAHMIATGDRWFSAWMMQNATPISRLEKLTGIPGARLWTIIQGDRISRAEVDALARAWSISAADLIASMPDPAMVVE